MAELEPGIHRDVPMAEYLAQPYMSASGLGLLNRSPLQYRHALTEPQRVTPALERGTALHMAVLEPLLYEARYAVAGTCDVLLASGKRKGEPCGNGGLFLHADLGWLCGVHVKSVGEGLDTSREILSPEQGAAVAGMRDAVLAHPRARSLFEGRGEIEVTVVWDDPETGVRCKARPDRLVERAGMLVDVKTSRDASPQQFPRLAENLGYFRKVAFYRRGLREVGWPYQCAAVLAIEPDAPFDLAPYLINDEQALDSAVPEIDRLLRLYRTCSDTDTWPGYADGAAGFLTLERPSWAGAVAEFSEAA